MIWKADNQRLISDCGEYVITNSGKPGGDRYVLYKRCDDKRFKRCHCQLITMGTLQEMKEAI